MKIHEIKRSAFDSLRGRWFIPIIAGILASFFGAGMGGNYTFTLVEYLGIALDNPVITIALAIVSILLSVAIIILGGSVAIGYAEFTRDLVDGDTPSLSTLFRHFDRLVTGICTALLVALHVFVGMIFLFIPGIIAAYRYSMVFYVLADNPQYGAIEALRESRKIMRGHKFKLFITDFTLIGWDFLALFTLGISNLWAVPYRQAVRAVFYRDICCPSVKYKK